MTAKEIREQYKGGNDLQVDVLAEIAAQLAELKVEVSRLADNVVYAAGKE